MVDGILIQENPVDRGNTLTGVPALERVSVVDGMQGILVSLLIMQRYFDFRVQLGDEKKYSDMLTCAWWLCNLPFQVILR